MRLGGNLDLLDYTRSTARLASAGTVALFARGLLYVQEIEGVRAEEPGESGAVARRALPVPLGRITKRSYEIAVRALGHGTPAF